MWERLQGGGSDEIVAKPQALSEQQFVYIAGATVKHLRDLVAEPEIARAQSRQTPLC